jgi:hypothetical protein
MLKGKQPRFYIKAFKNFISEKDIYFLRQLIDRLGSSHSFKKSSQIIVIIK